MTIMKYKINNNPNWLHWLDPLTHVNQNFEPGLKAKLKFEKISFKLKRDKILETLNKQIREKSIIENFFMKIVMY